MFGATSLHTSPPSPTSAQMSAIKNSFSSASQKTSAPMQDAIDNAARNLGEMIRGRYEQMQYWRRGITPLQLTPSQERVAKVMHQKLIVAFESKAKTNLVKSKEMIFNFEHITALKDSDILYLAAAQAAKKWVKP